MLPGIPENQVTQVRRISRYSTGVAARMVKILNDSDAELTARLLIALDSLDPGSFTVKRLESLLASVREVIAAMSAVITVRRSRMNMTSQRPISRRINAANA